MTLNQLALEMWEKLGCEGIDPSVISRVIKGERTFTFKQLEIFCQVLRLSGQRKKELEGRLLLELSHRFGLRQDFFQQENEFFVDLAEENLEKISEVIVNGLPKLACEWIDNVSERIREELALSKGEGRRKVLLSLLAKLLLERRRVVMQVSEPKEITNRTWAYTKELKVIALKLKDITLVKLANLGMGTTLRVSGKYKEALTYLKDVTDLDIADTYEITCFIREAALSQALSKNWPEYEKVKTFLEEKISNYPTQLQCLAAEGLARCEGIMENVKGASKALDKAWKLFDEVERQGADYRLFRKVELARTELELAIRFKSKNKNHLEKVGREALIISRELGYKRQEKEIESSINRLLN